MAETQNPAVANAVKKPVRRGVAAAAGTQTLKFDTRDVQQNGLFLAHLEKVETSTFTPGEGKTGLPSFNGLEVPRITFTFASNEDDANKRRRVYLQFNAVESTAFTIPGKAEEWKVNIPLNYLKHILDVFYFKGRELTEEETDALSLEYVDFDENGEYVSVAAEDVLSSWKHLFENVAAFLNAGKDGKPCFKTADNKFITVWIKLIRYFKTKTEWKEVNNGQLAFPQFVGEGVIEIFQPNVAPTIKLDITREKIKVMDLQKQQPKAPNMIAPVATVGGIDMSQYGLGGGPAPTAEEDLPF